MEEKILTKKKNGMVVLFLGIVMAIICVALFITGGNLLDNSDGTSVTGIICMVCALALACFTWVPFASLRVLKPQEALVLTLFAKYVGTLKGDGFYAVNPFCTAFNPAATTKLKQSGDVGHAGSCSKEEGGEAAGRHGGGEAVRLRCGRRHLHRGHDPRQHGRGQDHGTG